MSDNSNTNIGQRAFSFGDWSLSFDTFRRWFGYAPRKIGDIESQYNNVEGQPDVVVDKMSPEVYQAVAGQWTMTREEFREIVRSTGGDPDKIVYSDTIDGAKYDKDIEYLVCGDWSNKPHFDTFKAIVQANKVSYGIPGSK